MPHLYSNLSKPGNHKLNAPKGEITLHLPRHGAVGHVERIDLSHVGGTDGQLLQAEGRVRSISRVQQLRSRESEASCDLNGFPDKGLQQCRFVGQVMPRSPTTQIRRQGRKEGQELRRTKTDFEVKIQIEFAPERPSSA